MKQHYNYYNWPLSDLLTSYIMRDIINNEYFKKNFHNVDDISLIYEISSSEKKFDGNDYYSIFKINNHAFLSKLEPYKRNGINYYTSSKISYLGKDLSNDQLESILDGIRVLS